MPRVPDTTTFSLQDVVNVVGGSSLTEAFANARDWGFDPAYKGDKTNLYNFRNYNHPGGPLFVGITYSDNRPCRVYDDGTVVKLSAQSSYSFALGLRDVDYSSSQKNMMGIRNQGVKDDLIAFDLSTDAGAGYQAAFQGSGSIKTVLFDRQANNWFASSATDTNAELIGNIPASSVGSSWTQFMGSIPTSGKIHYASWGQRAGINTWYYCTENGETGRVQTLGGSGTELMDSSTHEYYFISLLGSIVAGFGKERDRNRWASTNSDTTWNTFVIGNSGGIHRAVQYPVGNNYTLAIMDLANGTHTIYSFDHANPSSTPQGIGTSDEVEEDVCVESSNIYALSRQYETSTSTRIWKKTSLTGPWSLQFTTSERLRRLWLY